MTHLSDDDVRHIAKLARLTLSNSEVKKFSKELTSILEYIDMLNELDTDNVEPLHQVTGMTNSLREDELETDVIPPDEILKTSPLPIVEHQIQTPSAHG